VYVQPTVAENLTGYNYLMHNGIYLSDDVSSIKDPVNFLHNPNVIFDISFWYSQNFLTQVKPM